MIVEDATGLPNANSYIDVNTADAYFADRGNTVWAALAIVEKEQNLIAATDYIDTRWGAWFKGKKFKESQMLEFPRDVFEDNLGNIILPENLKKATAEYAVRAALAPLAPDIEQDPTGYQASRKIAKVGPIEERTDYAFLGQGAIRKLIKPYPAADMLMRPLLENVFGSVFRN